jgi:preprotein translocase SecF subunit
VFEIIRHDTHFDFLAQRRLFIGLSLAMLAIGIVAVPLRGIRTGIDFAGGTEMQLKFAGEAPVDEGVIRKALGSFAVRDADVVRYGTVADREFLVRFQGELRPPGAEPKAAPADEDHEITPEERKVGVEAFQKALGEAVAPVEVERVEFVGPKVGAELRRDGMYAMALSWAAILIYLGFRFSLSYAPGAVVGLIHDVLVTCGLWVLLGLQFDLQVIAALLTIAGYSVNDTIIVYDRIREQLAVRTKRDLEGVVNDAINQTLSRTILTAGTTVLALLALLFLGGPVIRPFALAMTIGVVVGTYSSIYVASPLMIWLERRRARKAPAPARA